MTFAQILNFLAKRWIIYVVAWLAIWAVWAGLEVAIYGAVQPREVDNITGGIMWWSLIANYDHRV